MKSADMVLQDRYVRLEPLERRHIDGLVAAAAADPALYQWTSVPQGKEAATKYVESILADKESGSAVPFATIRISDDAVIGSTRFLNIEYWPWPSDHPSHGRNGPDACEIGGTWLSRSAVRTQANTEAKLLMLTHAFETWRVLRVSFQTDARNETSRMAIARLGAQFDGILRANRIASDGTVRDSAYYSIVAAEWPVVKARLSSFLNRRE